MDYDYIQDKKIHRKLDEIVIISQYLLETDNYNLQWSSGSDGYDFVRRSYCFFVGSTIEYETFYMSFELVNTVDDVLILAVVLSDKIRGSK